MGYACPVCETPQPDAGHLANHLAFTAITTGGDHEEWLDERVPEWGQLGESELAAVVVEDAPETEFPQVFEESGVGGDHGHDRQSGHERGLAGSDGGIDPSAVRSRGRGELDDEARAILEEAHEMTASIREDAESEQGSEDDAGERAGRDSDDDS